MEHQKRKILVVSHCFLNDATKLNYENAEEATKERTSKRKFLKKILEDEIEIVQLPCPEFLLYGSNRWGHAASQFDTPFFRETSRKLLEPVILQLEEYQKYPDRFELLGIMGIDGSPSCGIHFTYDGSWGGAFGDKEMVEKRLDSLQKVEKPGIFMQVFMEELSKKEIRIPYISIDDTSC